MGQKRKQRPSAESLLETVSRMLVQEYILCAAMFCALDL
jgi:hypothetical protein